MIIPYNKDKISYKQDWSGYVYIIKCGKFYKIGYSKNPTKRLSQLDTRPYNMDLIMSKFSFYAYKREQNIHSEFYDYQIANEWYDFSSRPINVSGSGFYINSNESDTLNLLFNIYMNWDDKNSSFEDFISDEEYSNMTDKTYNILINLDKRKDEYYRRLSLQ